MTIGLNRRGNLYRLKLINVDGNTSEVHSQKTQDNVSHNLFLYVGHAYIVHAPTISFIRALDDTIDKRSACILFGFFSSTT